MNKPALTSQFIHQNNQSQYQPVASGGLNSNLLFDDDLDHLPRNLENSAHMSEETKTHK